jgi:hypothetical protein
LLTLVFLIVFVLHKAPSNSLAGEPTTSYKLHEEQKTFLGKIWTLSIEVDILSFSSFFDLHDAKALPCWPFKIFIARSQQMLGIISNNSKIGGS